MVEQSASAAPSKSLKPLNCSGYQISPHNPLIPNLSSPVVSPSASSMDLPQISAPQLGHSQIQMKLYGAPIFPPKTPAMSPQQSNLMSSTSNLVMLPRILRSEPLSPFDMIDLQFVMAMKQSTSAAPAKSLKPPNCSGYQMTPSVPCSSQPAAHANTQQQISQLIQQQTQLKIVQQRQAAQLLQQQQQLQQLLQQPSTPAFGKNMTPEITSSNKDSGQLLGQRKIQDLVSQVRKALEFQLMESDAAANRLEAILQLLDPLIKSEQLSPPPAAGSHVLQKISQLWLLLSAAFSPCFPAELLSTKNQ